MTFKLLAAFKDSQKIEQIKQAFDHCDCQIIVAPSMSLALFLAQKNLPDLIVSEVNLLDGKGFRLLTEVQSSPELTLIPFVFYIDKDEMKELERERGAHSPIILSTAKHS
jgi:DNA-binding response OmpR family regulator